MKKQDTVIIIVIIKKEVLLMQEYAKYNAVKNVLRIYGVKNYIIYIILLNQMPFAYCVN